MAGRKRPVVCFLARGSRLRPTQSLLSGVCQLADVNASSKIKVCMCRVPRRRRGFENCGRHRRAGTSSLALCLMDGHARTSTELSVVAEVSPSTASLHLNRLKTECLVKVLVQGKHRFYSLERPDVAAALEGLGVLIDGSHDKFAPNTPSRLHVARSFYCCAWRCRSGDLERCAMVVETSLILEERDSQPMTVCLLYGVLTYGLRSLFAGCLVGFDPIQNSAMDLRFPLYVRVTVYSLPPRMRSKYLSGGQGSIS